MNELTKLQNIYKEFIPVPLTIDRRPFYNKLLQYIFDGEIRVEKVTKCLCGTSNFKVLNEMDRFGLPFGTQICNDCGLISLTRRIVSEDLGKYYDEIYWGIIFGGKLAEGELSTHGEDYGKKIFTYLESNIAKDIKEVNVFEVGCGTGEKLISLEDGLKERNIKANLFALDYSNHAVSTCQKKGINAALGGFDQANEFNEKFDIIILSHIVEHLVSPSDELEKLKKFLKNDGIIYIEVPGVSTLKETTDYGYDYNLYCVHAHMYNFTLDSLVSCMERVGYELVKGDEFVRSIFRPVSDVTSKGVSSSEIITKTISNLLAAEEQKSKYLGTFKRTLKRKVKQFIFPGIYR